MFPKSQLYYARTALSASNWECRYAGLELLRIHGEAADIPRVEECLSDPAAAVRAMALEVLTALLAFESETAIRRCLFDHDPEDPYGSLAVRETARTTLDAILAHTRPRQSVPQTVQTR